MTQDSTKNQSLMLRHILKTWKPSSTHITPLVTHQVLKKVLSKEKHLGPLESYEQTPQKLRLRITFQISTLIENLLSDIKCTERGNALLKQNKEKKEVLPFVTQYQPSVSPLKEVLMQKWNLIQKQPLLRQIFKEPPIISYKKGKSLKDMLVRAKL